MIDEPSPLPIPDAVYPCAYCYEEVSWPPEDLSWSSEKQLWICPNCWDDDHHGEPGAPTLSEEIRRQRMPAPSPEN